MSTYLGSWSDYCYDQIRNLCVVFDPELKFDKQINAVVKSCFFQIRSIARLNPILSRKDIGRLLMPLFCLVWTIAMCCMWSPARP